MILMIRSGGLEMLFCDQRKHYISLPKTDENGQPATLDFLVRFLCEHVMKDHRKELFVIDNIVSVLPFQQDIRSLIH